MCKTDLSKWVKEKPTVCLNHRNTFVLLIHENSDWFSAQFSFHHNQFLPKLFMQLQLCLTESLLQLLSSHPSFLGWTLTITVFRLHLPISSEHSSFISGTTPLYGKIFNAPVNALIETTESSSDENASACFRDVK